MTEYDARKDSFGSYNDAIAAMRAKLLRERCPAAKRVEVIGQCELYLGDCREIMPTLGRVDNVCTDPPYGMRWNGKKTRGKNGTGKAGKTRNYGTTIINDDKPFDPSFLLSGRPSIIFGMNHFPQHLHRGTCLVWVKRYDEGFGSYLSDAEVAFFTEGHGVYCFRDLSNQGESSNRLHPAQKPLPLMSWCLTFLTGGGIVLDPYMGSGTTGVACAKAGRGFIGIEIDEGYFDISCERIRQAYRQPDMLIAPAPQLKAEQIGLIFDGDA